MSSRTRVFVTTSHISALYMTLHARATWIAGDRDVFLVDIGTRSTAVLAAIYRAAALHRWDALHSHSTVAEEDHRFEPGLMKRLTRRWKEVFPLRPLYDRSRKRFEQRRDARLMADLERTIGALLDVVDLEVFGHTQTVLNDLIARMRPRARSAYFEHGLGDYLYLVEGGRPRGPMYALFASGFKRFLSSRGIAEGNVRQLELPADFHSIALEQLSGVAPDTVRSGSQDRPVVLVLLEAVDMYEVPDAFWGAYIDHVLAVLDEPQRFHFLLKPHPIASAGSLRATEAHCERLGLSYELLDAGWQRGIAAEVLFAQWTERTHHVFCLFSSACFYLSQLYRQSHITYHCSPDFMDRWTGQAPPMYKRHFEGLKPLIKEVFSERCIPY